MKACVLQPYYSTDYAQSQSCFEAQLALLSRCDETMDLIVLPESCDVPALARTKEQDRESAERFRPRLLKAAAETAVRCRAAVFVNASSVHKDRLRNTTYVFAPDGSLVGQYDKQHLTKKEECVMEKDAGYTYEPDAPCLLTLDGVRYAFLTCYDFYFYENFSNLARFGPDVIIGCSHQRSDPHEALSLITRFLAYNTGAYVVRASVTIGEDSELGGCSMIAAPDGTVLTDMKSRVGLACAEFDPHERYEKPAGFGNPPAPHRDYVEAGRRPWKYRPAGPATVPSDEAAKYPRLCAHRGFNTVAPENSLPAFGAAVALGATEIEFDLWFTADGEIVSVHDAKLDRVSNGEGKVYEHTLAELETLDFGSKTDDAFRGLRIVRFEDILRKFSRHVLMNVHLKNRKDTPWEPELLQKVGALLDQYDCRRHVYFMSGSDLVLEQLSALLPDVTRCCGGGPTPETRWAIVERAIRYGCKKLQFFEEYFTQEMIDRAHENGLKCNYFYADDPEQAKKLIDMGIDTLLTNDYQRIRNALNIR